MLAVHARHHGVMRYVLLLRINKDLSFRTPTRAALLNSAVVLNYISIQLVVQTALYAAAGLHPRKSVDGESEFALSRTSIGATKILWMRNVLRAEIGYQHQPKGC